ncbi:MAG: TlpA disulfide reductase family protein [bacterium]|nr:TlpA disulfide reductase family protein [bacterium]
MKHFILFLLAAALVACGAPKSTESELSESAGFFPGKKAPDFSLKTLDGQTFVLSKAGKPVLLNFWATWCGPCVSEMPALKKLHEDMGNDVLILGVDLQESSAQVEAFVRQHNLTWTFLLDGTGQVGQAYAISAIPTTIAINAQGVITARHVGGLDYNGLKEIARSVLGK